MNVDNKLLFNYDSATQHWILNRVNDEFSIIQINVLQ